MQFMPMLDFEDLANFYQLNSQCKAFLTPKNDDSLDYGDIFAQYRGHFMDPNRRTFLSRITKKYMSFPVVLKTVRNFEARKGIKFQ